MTAVPPNPYFVRRLRDRWEVVYFPTGAIVRRYRDLGLARRMAIALNREAIKAAKA